MVRALAESGPPYPDVAGAEAAAVKERHGVKRLASPHGLYLRLSISVEDEGLRLGEAVDRLLGLAGNAKT